MKYMNLVKTYGFDIIERRLQLTARELNVLLAHEMSIEDGFDDWKDQMKTRMIAADRMMEFVSKRTGRGMYFTQVEWLLDQINSHWDCLPVVLKEVQNWIDFESAEEICRELHHHLMHFKCGNEV